MTERLHCEVPFCRRTRGPRKAAGGRMLSEWICAEHWRGVPRQYRRVYLSRRRLAEAAFCFGTPDECASAFDRADRLWKRCKRAAIERAGGIG